MAPPVTVTSAGRRRGGVTMTHLLMVLTVISRTSAAPQLPIVAEGDTAPPSPRCPPGCQQAVLRSVCGTDGTTYLSQCHLGLAACRGAAVQLKHIGQCVATPGDSACLRKREEALADHPGGTVPQNIYVPQCTEDGMYAEVQCHRGSGHCWCVDDQGQATFGTAVLNAQPDCSSRSSRDSSPVGKSTRRRGKKRRRRGCGSRAKTLFRADVMQMIKQEYERRRRNRNNRGHSGGDNLERLAAVWKFSRLDRNKDEQISRREIRPLRRKARRHLKPAACASRFYRYCDTNSNRRLSKQEWLLCVGVNRDDISFRVFLALNEERDGPSDGGVTDPPATTDARPEPIAARSRAFQMLASNTGDNSADEQVNSCEADRRQALDNQRLAELEGKLNNSFFIPTCTSDHKYSRVQCHNTTGYCWCADPETGKSYPQASVQGSVPDCSDVRLGIPRRRAQTHRRTQKGSGRLPKACRGASRLQMFLRELMDHLTSKMIRALQEKKYILPDTPVQKSFEEKVAEWKFTTTDANKNNVLDKREWKVLRQQFSLHPKLKKCGRRLPRYCDANNDRKIDMDEWLVCVGAVDDEPRPAKGPNPFEAYLTSSEQ